MPAISTTLKESTITTISITSTISLIEMNQKHLVRAYEQQNLENYEESVRCLEKIYKNFTTLGIMADQFAYTPLIIRENREMLSQAHLDSIYDKVPNCCEIEKATNRLNKKIKQTKVKWSEEEQKLFLEGLEKYGIKNLKKVSDHIGTRTVSQVRSHLQKHLLREKRIKEKSTEKNEINNKNSGKL